MEDGCLARTEMEGTKKFPVLCVTEEGKRDLEDILARESSLSVILNGRELATLLCTPSNLDYLAVGFIASEGLANFSIGILGSVFSSGF